MNIYFRLSGFHSSLLLIHFRYGPNTYLFTLHQSVAQNLSAMRVTVGEFRDRRGATSLRYRNRAEITVLMCEQKPYPVWFSYRRKIYPVYCEHSLRPDSRKASDWFDLHPCLHSCIEVMTGRTILCADSTSLGTLRNHDGDGNGNVKKVIGLISKTTTLYVHHAFFVHFFAVSAQLRREMTKF